MMQAIVNRKRVEDEQAQLKARIVKLRKEKERSMKHIKDMNRQQELMSEMHEEKKGRRAAFQNLRNDQKCKEDQDREVFKNMR